MLVVFGLSMTSMAAENAMQEIFSESGIGYNNTPMVHVPLGNYTNAVSTTFGLFEVYYSGDSYPPSQLKGQLRCGEAYLEILPSYFNCEYNGTLIKGDNFGPSWMPEDMAEKMVAHYEKMGKAFAEKKSFCKEEVNEFAGPEYFSEKMIRQHKRIGRWMQKAMFNYIAKKNGCKKPLDDKPYQVN